VEPSSYEEKGEGDLCGLLACFLSVCLFVYEKKKRPEEDPSSSSSASSFQPATAVVVGASSCDGDANCFGKVCRRHGEFDSTSRHHAAGSSSDLWGRRWGRSSF
jgi:hypothetical protein